MRRRLRVFRLSRLCMDDQHELTPAAVRIGREPGRQALRWQAVHGLELFRQLAAQRQRPRAAGFGQGCGQRVDAVRRFEQHLRLRARGQRLQRQRALAAARRQEADEGERPAERVAGHAERRHCAARPRDRHNPVAGGLHRRHQRGARVADGRRAGIADTGHALAARKPQQHAGRGFAFVVRMHREQRFRVDAERAQQGRAVARVFAGDGIDETEHMDGAQAQVGQVADRRGHHVQCAGWVLLRARRAGGDLAQERHVHTAQERGVQGRGIPNLERRRQ